MGGREILVALRDGAEKSIAVAVPCAAAGIIIAMGDMGDSAVVLVENAHRKLAQEQCGLQSGHIHSMAELVEPAAPSAAVTPGAAFARRLSDLARKRRPTKTPHLDPELQAMPRPIR